MQFATVFSLRTALTGAAVLLLAGLIYAFSFGFWASRTLVDSDTFASVTVSALSEASSREVLASTAVDQIVMTLPRLDAVRGPLADVIYESLASERLQQVLSATGSQLHAILFDGSSEGLVLDFSQIRDRIVERVAAISPLLARAIPEDLFGSIEIVKPGAVPELSPAVDTVRTVMWVALIVVVAISGLVWWRSRSKSAALFVIGLGVTISGLVTALTVPGGRAMTLGTAEDPGVEVLVSNLYDAMIEGLKFQSRLVLVFGILLMVAGYLLRRRESSAAEAVA